MRLDICYGSLSLFTSILNNVFLLYHVDIFVSVYKIDKMSFWVGEAIFLVWNSVNDPLFGWISDRSLLFRSFTFASSNQNHNRDIIKRRITALRINGPLFALSFMSFWMLWIFPSLQFVICLCLYDTFLSVIDLHHSALLADMAISADARTRLNSYCSIFSALGSASVFLSYTVWNKDDLTSFRLFCVVLAIFSFIGFMIMSRLLEKAYSRHDKESVLLDCVTTYTNGSHRQGSDGLEKEEVGKLHDISAIKSFLTQLISHKNFLYFSLMNLIQVFHCHFNSNFFPLFLENLLGDSIGPGVASFLIGLSFVAPHINNLYFLSLCRKYGVYYVIRLLFVVKLVLGLVMLLLGPAYLWPLCLFIASNRVFTEGTCKLLSLVISDLVDEDFVVNTRSQPVSALFFGTAALLSKPGQTLAPLIGTWLLAKRTGHDIFAHPHSATPTLHSEHRQGCFDILVYVPIVCAIVQLLVWSRFNLHSNRLSWVKSVRVGRLGMSV